jgi:SAM-dependent methyltransferase
MSTGKPISFDRTMEFWRSEKVDPFAYTQVKDGRSERLLEIVKPYSRSSRVLELGCGPGRNLEYLREAGFLHLTGIEINPFAIETLKQTYPRLAKAAMIMPRSLEDALPIMADDSYDLVYTMAVLLHIHPDSDWIFPHIARITQGRLITIEHEGYGHYDWCYSRDYRAIFEGLGMPQVDEVDFGEACALAGEGPYIARTFEKKAG